MANFREGVEAIVASKVPMSRQVLEMAARLQFRGTEENP
jgi:hypothetical protein